MPSFAVIDFSHKGDGHELVTGLLRRAAEHGLKNNQFEREYSQVVNELVIKANPLHQSGDMVQQVRKGCSLLKRLSKHINSHASLPYISYFCFIVLQINTALESAIQRAKGKLFCRLYGVDL